ncbi:hypothetical protein HF086_014296 [Spodoptera exigua]|uniref:FLYWCH-type domain-containing protein n=1 Tax=Spodoptera exigua TaxID=7107 RepID=A0A922M7I6_SPOEX|nr:hypothetical protein HF086_014296 [Spodoptera exigua]
MGSDFKFIMSQKGKTLILLNDYTYWHASQGRRKKIGRWRCSSHNSRRCKAKLEVDRFKHIIQADLNHTHPPPKYCVNNGKYFRIA